MRHDAAEPTPSDLRPMPRYGELWTQSLGCALTPLQFGGAHHTPPSNHRVSSVSKVVRKKNTAWGFVGDRPLTEVACSGHFWRGFVNGFAPQGNLVSRWTIHNLAEGDTIRYSWDTVGECMNTALNGVTVT